MGLNLHLPDLDSTVNSEMRDATLSEEKHAELVRKFGALNSLDVSSSSSSFPPAPTLMQRAELKLSDIAECLRQDWTNLAAQLGLTDQDVQDVRKEYGESVSEQALGSLHLWYETMGNKATGNVLEKALKQIGREDIVQKCMYNVQTVTDDKEKQEAKKQLIEAAGAVNQCGFEAFEEEVGDV